MIRLANTPAPHVAIPAYSVLDLFGSKNMPPDIHRPIPSPEPNPEPNPGPDAAVQSTHDSHANIAQADWDALFRAVQVRLEQCVGNAIATSPELALHDRHEVTKAAVLECVEAMTQLHAALTLERQEWQARQLQATPQHTHTQRLPQQQLQAQQHREH